jgi:hypothetical protein
MTDELKPVRCGCGGEAKVSKIDKSFLGGEFVYGYRCEKCGIATLWYASETEAIKAWNRAMGVDKVDELMEHVWREKLDTRDKIADLVERMLR